MVGIELSRTDATYQWDTVGDSREFRKVTLFDRDIGEHPPTAIEERLSAVLHELAPSVIATPGWGDPGSLLALKWACARGVPAIAMSETTQTDIDRNVLREAAKTRIIGMFSGAIVGGRLHREYLERLGMHRDRIVLGYDCVDNDYFAAGAQAARARAPDLLRELRLPERFFLASSRFIERKNLAGLVRAYARYRALAKENAWHLVILGDGPLRATLEAQVRAADLGANVSLPGFVQYGDLPRYYGLAGAFIHPAFAEPWGLVVNEAMASALPVLVSRQSGCAHELVVDGRNGFSFDAADVEALARLMLQIAASAALPAFGAASQALVARWSCAVFARNLNGLAAALVAQGAPRRPGLIDRGLLSLAIQR